MDSVASATRDLCQLSVSENPTPSRKFEPIDFSELPRCGSVSFTTSRTNWKSTAEVPKWYFARLAPEAPLSKSIKNYLIPEEFAEDGVHTIRIVRTSAAYRKAAAKPIPVELIALQREYMVY
ncbi:hypothetical protein C5167_002225 [Papaver somniferum]|uniref:Uncharacterized protein n=1 Tax=Papaver somniferum TaxID=3469 RepID=A0A4Y7KXJ1_PAPSO|nr:hypothetical protein C5167_002225 [Papaver somniferum]